MTEQRLEPAVPPHLSMPRTVPRRGDKTPRHPSHSARFSESVTFHGWVTLAIQSLPEADISKAEALFNGGIAHKDGPQSHDVALHVDPKGYENRIFNLYWIDKARFDRWNAALGDSWWYNGLDPEGDIGVYKHALSFTPRDFETTFTHQYPEGISKLGTMSGLTDTHEYTGSFIDRIPRGQYDTLAPVGRPHLRTGEPLPVNTRGRLLAIVPNKNMVVMRSGQDWVDTKGDERSFYLEKLEPVLAVGMKSTLNRSDCYFNIYPASLLDDQGRSTEKSFSFSAWFCVDSLNDWTANSNEHRNIMGTGMLHYIKAGENAKLRLYHELCVVEKMGPFEYFNCHDETGMLRAMK